MKEPVAARLADTMFALSTPSRVQILGCLREGFFIDLLRRHYSVEEARAQLETAIDWGRNAELYAYDASRRELTLDTQAGFGA